jgi:GT2 family glycosyltransferase
MHQNDSLARRFDHPSISLIISSRNRPQLLAETVESVLRGSVVPDELIVVDQSDLRHEQLAQLVARRPCAFTYLWVPSKGLSKANNTAIRRAQHDILVFTHDDVFVADTWLSTLVEALFAAGPRSIVTGRVLPAEGDQPGGFVPTLQLDPNPAVYTGRPNKNVLYVLNMALPRAAIAEIGSFDERLGPGTPFPGGEDSDFGFRLLEAGYRIVYEPAAIVYHRAWRAAAERDQIRQNYGRSQGAFYAKYFSLRDQYMSKRMVTEIAHRSYNALCQMRSHRAEAHEQLRTIWAILAGAVQWLMIQRNTP